MTNRNRALAFFAIAVACAGLAVFYAIRASRRNAASDARQSGASADAAALGAILRAPHLLFRNTMVGAGYGHLMAVPLSPASTPALQTSLECERVDFAGGFGVCLTANRDVLTSYAATVFDASLQPLRSVPLSGIPSRVRVAPNGRLAGITVFVTGHAYSQSGFSTRTTLLDTQTGATRADLEQFTVRRNGGVFKAQDFNFWGVTFARDSNTFYATLSSGGTMYLVRGDAAAAEATVLGEGVECPSLSPDNSRVAYKKRQIVSGRLVWRLAVRDLGSGADRILSGETRSVDDQVEWLDDRRILYALPDRQRPGSTDVVVVPVDGGPATTYVRAAYSPSVVSGRH